MLGLGNSVVRSGVTEELSFTPASINNLTVWLAVNTNITADQNSAGGSLSPEHSTAAGTMAQADRINLWGASGSTSINAVQTNSSYKPRWETSTGNLGGLRSSNNNKYMDLSSAVTVAANTDFTIVIRFKPDVASDLRGLIGDDSGEFIRKQNATTFRVKTDNPANTDPNRDIVFGTAMQDDKIITLMIVRSSGSTGNIDGFLRSNVSGYFDGTATGTAAGNTIQDSQEFIIDTIMAQGAADTIFDGNFYDVIIYNGTAVTASQREQLFDYIEGQSHPQ